MLYIAVLVIAALTASCLGETNYIAGDPHIWSHYGGDQTCSFSSAAWLQTFFSPRINIESVFSDLNVGQQHPTVQTSFRITFTNVGTLQTQTYVAVDPSLPFSNTFLSGSPNAGWVFISNPNPLSLQITDLSTGAVITANANGNHYNLFMNAPSWIFANGRGLLVQGCPQKDVFDYNTNNFLLPYNANQNWGRKKRAAEKSNPECDEIARVMAKEFPDIPAFGFEPVRRTCTMDAKFIKDAPSQYKNRIEMMRHVEETIRKNFSDETKLEAYNDYEHKADVKKI